MKIGYYPGCTLKSKAKNLELAAIRAMEVLGVELVELDRWNCCGAVYSLADDDLVHYLAPVRDLIRAKDQGFDRVVTLCSMCYNTLARANLLMREDIVKRDAINDYLEEESTYQGEVEVLHLLNLLRNDIGWDQVKSRLKVPLEGLKLGPYYGCTLTRPRTVSIEDPNSPLLFREFVESIGADYVEFSDAETCCGSYQVISNPDAASITARRIVESANRAGADALLMSCPLCEYNLGRRQAKALEGYEAVSPIPSFYFTQLLALALGVQFEELGLALNMPLAAKFLEERGIVTPA